MTVGFSGSTFKSDTCDTEILIYLDGNLEYTFTLAAEDLPRQISIPLNSALQLKVERQLHNSLGNTSEYGFADIIVH